MMTTNNNDLSHVRAEDIDAQFDQVAADLDNKSLSPEARARAIEHMGAIASKAAAPAPGAAREIGGMENNELRKHIEKKYGYSPSF